MGKKEDKKPSPHTIAGIDTQAVDRELAELTQVTLSSDHVNTLTEAATKAVKLTNRIGVLLESYWGRSNLSEVKKCLDRLEKVDFIVKRAIKQQLWYSLS
ncbi:MAG: hypothetical protein ACXABY_15940 [Candidatus Thorarchaeota archaeon]|jgi:hypothetical protein